MKCRWFFAHAKQTPDDVIDAWTATLCERLSSADVEAVVTPGRDDYMKRSRAMPESAENRVSKPSRD